MHLTLDENHIYRLDGAVIPGVTTILDSHGLISSFAKDPIAAERGRLVHDAAFLLVQGRLDWATVDARLLGYVLSYAQLLDHTQWLSRAAEVSQWDPDYLFAGTFDADFESNWLADLKTGTPSKWHPLQTAAYKRLNGDKGRRAAIYLQADGSMAKLLEHTDRSDWPNFLSCLNVYRLKEQANGSSSYR